MILDDIKYVFNKAVTGVKNFFSQIQTGNQGYDTSNNTIYAAIELWIQMYKGNAPWLHHNTQSLGLPAAIAAEIARLVTLEMQCKVTAPTGTPEGEAVSQRANYIQEQLDPLLDNIRILNEYACAGGGIMFKPYISGDKIAIDIVQAMDFHPVSFDHKGRITSCSFVEHKKQKNKYYHRVEHHEFVNDDYVVTNKAYQSNDANTIGQEIALTSVPEWADLNPSQTIKGLHKPLFAYFKIPLGNTVDPSSPLGVSVYARAARLIEDADKQYQRYLWEFEGGELAIDAPNDLFAKDKNGDPILPDNRDRLYRTYDLDGMVTTGSEWIKVFAPTLRETDIGKGLNTILQKIEFNVGLAYGTLSDPQSVERTATEIMASKQRSYSTITAIQRSLQYALEDLIDIIDVYATLYNLAPQGNYETAFVWDDSIVVDAESERARDLNEVRLGIMPKWEYRVKWYGEDEETARNALADNSTSSEGIPMI